MSQLNFEIFLKSLLSLFDSKSLNQQLLSNYGYPKHLLIKNFRNSLLVWFAWLKISKKNPGPFDEKLISPVVPLSSQLTRKIQLAISQEVNDITIAVVLAAELQRNVLSVRVNNVQLGPFASVLAGQGLELRENAVVHVKERGERLEAHGQRVHLRVVVGVRAEHSLLEGFDFVLVDADFKRHGRHAFALKLKVFQPDQVA